MSKLSIIKYIAWKISCEIFDLNPILLTLCHKFQYAIWCTNSIFGLFLCPGYPNPVDRILMGTFFMSKVDVVYELAVHSMLGLHDLPHSQDQYVCNMYVRGFTVECGLKFHWYLRTLSLKGLSSNSSGNCILPRFLDF